MVYASFESQIRRVGNNSLLVMHFGREHYLMPGESNALTVKLSQLGKCCLLRSVQHWMAQRNAQHLREHSDNESGNEDTDDFSTGMRSNTSKGQIKEMKTH